MSDYVCKLHKAIYGLRQAPRAWYVELSTFLIEYGFKNSTVGAFLFIYDNKGVKMYFLVYVNDLVLQGNSSHEVNKFLDKMVIRFSLKYLVQLHFFLGFETIFKLIGLLLSQHKYNREIFYRFGVSEAKETETPMASTTKLKLKEFLGSKDETEFRQGIEALKFISFAQPNVTFSVNKLEQFMHAPTQNH